jgi:hypothetical protein
MKPQSFVYPAAYLAIRTGIAVPPTPTMMGLRSLRELVPPYDS